MERAEDCYESVLAELRAKKKRLEETDTSQLTQDELRKYEYDLKVYRDLKNSLDTAYRQGVELGRAEARGWTEGYKQGLIEGYEQGYAEGLKQGRAEGLEQGRVKFIKAMLKHGMDIKTISELSGLTEEEIKKL